VACYTTCVAIAAASPEKVHPFRLAREARGLSLREAADLAKVDWSWLARVERGDAEGSLAWLSRVAAALGLQEDAARFARYDRVAR
jgi:transcriptional regulator with XRE-family HTH domain